MCGILCITGNNNISLDTFLDYLKYLQGRGQDSFGYAYIKDSDIVVKNIDGLIKNYKNYDNIKSYTFLGHTKYITSGPKDNTIHQPIKGKCKFGEFVMIFNGNIPIHLYNEKYVRTFQTDTELIKSYLEEKSELFDNIEDVLIEFLNTFKRAYSLILYIDDTIYLLRDIYGVRPLMYSISKYGCHIASEIDSTYTYSKIQDIDAGTLTKIKNLKLEIIYKYKGKEQNQGNCLFEYIYYMNQSNSWNNINVESIRNTFGTYLAKNENSKIIENKENYVVIGIPNSGIRNAKQYAKTLDITYSQLITKNKDVNRTFILKNDYIRKTIANKKYIFDAALKNKNVIIVDDSIVRGITMSVLIKNLKEYGVNEIHIRIASPKIKYECYYGIDIPTKEELFVNKYNEQLDCDSLLFLDLDKFKEIMPNYKNLCTGCFSGKYD